MRHLEIRIRELEELSRRLISRVMSLEDRHDKMVRHGKVTDVDTKKQLARMEVGLKDGTTLKSPWVPYAQRAGPDGQSSDDGEWKFHNPPAVGQQMTLFSPNGEFRQGMILPFTWHDKAKSPSQSPDEHVVTYGKIKDTYKKTERQMSVGDAVSLDMTTDTITLKAGTIILQGEVLLGSKDANRPLALQGTVDTGGNADVSNLSTAVKAI